MAFSANPMLFTPPQDYYRILSVNRTATQEELLYAYSGYKPRELREMTSEIEEGKVAPEVSVVYVKPGTDFFDYVTFLTPVLAAKPIIQMVTKSDFEAHYKSREAPVPQGLWAKNTPLDFVTIKTHEKCIFDVVSAKKHLGPIFIGAPKPQQALKQAYEVLSNPKMREGYETSLDAYFLAVYQAVKKRDLRRLEALTGLAPAVDGGNLLPMEHSYLGFAATDKEARTLVWSLGAEGDMASLKFLADHFRPYFHVHDLAYMGADLTTAEIESNNTPLIADYYARGNHAKKVDEMVANYPGVELEATRGYMISGNAAEAEKLVAITKAKNGAPTKLENGFYLGGYLKDPAKLVNFLASASPAFRSSLVKSIKGTTYQSDNGEPIPEDEIAIQQDLPAFEALAIKIAAAGPSADAENLEPSKDLAQPSILKDKTKEQPKQPNILLGDLKRVSDLSKIFDEAIATATAIPAQDKALKKKFVQALSALKVKTVTDRLQNQFKDPEDAVTIAKATQTLVQDIQDPAKRDAAVKHFETTIEPFKTTWDWKMILGAIIGFAIGFIAGALIGAAAAPAAAATALAGGVAGAWIGASFFGTAAACIGGAIGVKLEHCQDPLRQTIAAGTIFSNTLKIG